jgi:FlaA1/EpsC-like NDP-sugar epimerase
MGGLRLAMRYYFGEGLRFTGRILLPFGQDSSPLAKVAIYGAGAAGSQLVNALRMSKTMQPVAFIDDDESLYKRTIAGLKVYDPSHIARMITDTGAVQLLLAVPSASRARRKEILSSLEPFPLHVRTVPGFMDLASGRVQVQDVQEVDIADLLGRDEVAPHAELFERCIKNQVVMVTGAGGSIGSELCRQIVASGATTLILYEHSEFNLYHIHHELEERIKREALKLHLVPILGSIRNSKRMQEVMITWQVNTVYHAAAYKHVPMVEHNTVEGILNNVMGTLYTAQAAIVAGVKNFVLISTDKAVRPTNVMGSTKRLAEMVLQALSTEKNIRLFNKEDSLEYSNNTRFTMVRFGNVLGSSGSVIPLFREQIKRGGPVTVTHPNITRYFMTIPEAAQLVIQAGSMGQGGDVFVLDMGEPVKIAELAEKMITLTGLSVKSERSPNGDIAIEFTGLRPGEKLYEELLIGDNVSATEHPKIMRANETMLPWHELERHLFHLAGLAKSEDCIEIRKTLRELVDGYQPQGEIVDLVYNKKKSDDIGCIGCGIKNN